MTENIGPYDGVAPKEARVVSFGKKIDGGEISGRTITVLNSESENQEYFYKVNRDIQWVVAEKVVAQELSTDESVLKNISVISENKDFVDFYDKVDDPKQYLDTVVERYGRTQTKLQILREIVASSDHTELTIRNKEISDLINFLSSEQRKKVLCSLEVRRFTESFKLKHSDELQRIVSLLSIDKDSISSDEVTQIAFGEARKLQEEYEIHKLLYGQDHVSETNFVIGNPNRSSDSLTRDIEIHIFQEKASSTLKKELNPNYSETPLRDLKKMNYQDLVDKGESEIVNFIDQNRDELCEIYEGYELSVLCGNVPDLKILTPESSLGVLFSDNFGIVQEVDGDKIKNRIVNFDFGLPRFNLGLSLADYKELKDYISEVRESGGTVVQDGKFSKDYREKLSTLLKLSLVSGRLPTALLRSDEYQMISDFTAEIEIAKLTKDESYLSEKINSFSDYLVSIAEEFACSKVSDKNADINKADLDSFRRLVDIH